MGLVNLTSVVTGLIQRAGVTVTLGDTNRTPIIVIRELDRNRVAMYTGDGAPYSDTVQVFYATAPDYTAYLTDVAGYDLFYRGVRYKIMRVFEQEDGDVMQMAPIVCERSHM